MVVGGDDCRELLAEFYRVGLDRESIFVVGSIIELLGRGLDARRGPLGPSCFVIEVDLAIKILNGPGLGLSGKK